MQLALRLWRGSMCWQWLHIPCSLQKHPFQALLLLLLVPVQTDVNYLLPFAVDLCVQAPS
jgi:hypothetical protein